MSRGHEGSSVWPGCSCVVGLGVCCLLALSLRLAVFHSLVTRPFYERLPVGHDQRTYQFEAQEMLRDHYPAGPFYTQPGISLMLGTLYRLWGLDVRLLPLLQTISGAFLIPLVFDLTRRIFSVSSAWIAVLLWLTFPLAMFYEAQLLTHGLEAQMGALLLWLWLRASTSAQAHRGWWWMTLGLALGASSVWRPTFLALVPCMAGSLTRLGAPSWKAKAGWLAALTLATLAPIAPITWYNYQASGRFQLLTSNTSVTLYLGNNRDSSGLTLTSPAFCAASTLVRQGVTTYTQQTWADIRADPERWLRLMLRKVALYLGDREIPNNVDFYLEGVAVSPVLAALPVRFGLLLVLALTTTALVLCRQLPLRPGVWFIWIYLVAQMLVTILHNAFSRFRAPLYASSPTRPRQMRES